MSPPAPQKVTNLLFSISLIKFVFLFYIIGISLPFLFILSFPSCILLCSLLCSALVSLGVIYFTLGPFFFQDLFSISFPTVFSLLSSSTSVLAIIVKLYLNAYFGPLLSLNSSLVFGWLSVPHYRHNIVRHPYSLSSRLACTFNSLDIWTPLPVCTLI